ncbi:putative lipase 1 [[Candida] jaroonii]|uniref:Lipase 1 n=1 Tax=[Candida] jaroonii TaxID=467808 RepID=A0ACA9YB93_9ASCO|nr:putative lipase 1 [[Candida] jaroonii]
MNIFWFFFAVVFASPIKLLEPEDDSFYQPTDNFEHEEPGTILKIRKAPYQMKSIHFPVNVSNVWQILVRSEDALGNASAVVSTLFEPYNSNNSRLVSYHVAEDAPNVNCGPSFAFAGGGFSSVVTKLEMILIQSALNFGYYVLVPDYEGPLSAFTVGPTAGYSILNSIRGVLQTDNVTNLSPDADVVLWGFSGGSFASSWAAGLAPTYAEDLSSNLKGCALGGWLTNITSMFEIIEGSIFVGLTPNAIAGMTNQFPEFETYIQSQLTDDRKKSYEEVYGFCLSDSIVNYVFTDFFTGNRKYFRNGWKMFEDAAFKKFLDISILGTNETDHIKPDIPIFLFHGEKDEIVPYKDSQRVYDVWCNEKDGMDSFEFASSTSSGHLLEVFEGSGAALEFIQRVFEGKELVKGCKKTSRTTNLFYPGAVTQYINIIKSLYKNIRNQPIGPKDKRSLFDSEWVDNFEMRSLLGFLES